MPFVALQVGAHDRQGKSCIALPTTELFVFGTVGPLPVFLNDSHPLDVEALKAILFCT